MASEMVLARLLAQENSWLSTHWYYSTELRVVSITQIFALLFKVFSSWRLVRLGGVTIALAGFSAASIYLGRLCHQRHFALLATAWLLLPLCTDYFRLMISGGDYLVTAALTFLLVALSLDGQKRHRWQLFALASAIIGLLLGLGGPRGLATATLPFVLAWCGLFVYTFFASTHPRQLPWRTPTAHGLLIAASGFIASLVGYLINSRLLPAFYSFRVYHPHLTSPQWFKILPIFQDFLHSPGWINHQPLAFCLAITFLLGALLAAILPWCINASLQWRYLSLFFVCNLLIFIYIYVFTDMEYVARYNLLPLLSLYPLLATALTNLPLKTACRSALIWILSLLLIGRASFVLSDIVHSPTDPIHQVADYLATSPYHQGFATFWHANVLTEFSHGQLEVWAWDPDIARAATPESLFAWLQVKEHLQKPPRSPVFFVITTDELPRCSWCHLLASADQVAQFGPYLVYGLPNYTVMVNRWIQNDIYY
ncbi:hypothetical protein IJJ12_00430 [bacterium]|nr:hypothetical protein [bacterium]